MEAVKLLLILCMVSYKELVSQPNLLIACSVLPNSFLQTLLSSLWTTAALFHYTQIKMSCRITNTTQSEDKVQNNTDVIKQPAKNLYKSLRLQHCYNMKQTNVCQQTYFYTKTQFEIKTRFNCLSTELQLGSIYIPFIKIMDSRSSNKLLIPAVHRKNHMKSRGRWYCEHSTNAIWYTPLILLLLLLEWLHTPATLV